MAKRDKTVKLMRWLNAGIFPPLILFSVGFSYVEIMKYLKKIKAWDWELGLTNDAELINGGEYFGLHRTIENPKTGEKKELFYIIITPQFNFTDDEMANWPTKSCTFASFLFPQS